MKTVLQARNDLVAMIRSEMRRRQLHMTPSQYVMQRILECTCERQDACDACQDQLSNAIGALSFNDPFVNHIHYRAGVVRAVRQTLIEWVFCRLARCYRW